MQFAREDSESVLGEIVPLMADHDREVIDDITREWPLDVDVDVYRRIEAIGRLRVFTAREDGALVGYAIFMIVPSTHRRSLLIAHEDALYLKPEHRKLGIARKLMKFAEAELATECPLVIYHSPCGSPRFGQILGRTGYTKYSEHFARRL